MNYPQAERAHSPALHSIHMGLLSFPVACFTLAVLTDLAYWATENLQWLHFSEWLLLAGLIAGAIELLVLLLEFLVRRTRPSWLAVIFGIAVLLLATVNSFVHTIDGWQAVVPNGLILSAVTVLAMLATAWFARRGWQHV